MDTLSAGNIGVLPDFVNSALIIKPLIFLFFSHLYKDEIEDLNIL